MTYVMSDIHGNSKRFDSVMEQIKLQLEDTLYILGDVIDRYSDGIRILRRIMKMPNVKMLLGNHEYMMLEALQEQKDILENAEGDVGNFLGISTNIVCISEDRARKFINGTVTAAKLHIST